MADKRNDGGSAFPVVDSDMGGDHGEVLGRVYSVGGMTLRDYFASSALAALVSVYGDESQKEINAQRAYDYADAMLKARGKQ